MSVLPRTGFERALWPTAIAVAGVIVLSVAVVFLWVARNTDTTRVVRQNCRAIENLKAVEVRSTLRKDAVTMARTDLPPSVKAEIHEVNLETVRSFSPRACP